MIIVMTLSLLHPLAHGPARTHRSEQEIYSEGVEASGGADQSTGALWLSR